MLNRTLELRHVLLLATFLLAACAAPPGPPEPVVVKGQIVAAEDLNPDFNGRASPAVMRIYQLKSPGAFEAADFFALYRSEAATLAADLVNSSEQMLRPGQTQPLLIELDPATRYVGVLVAFREIGDAAWRAGVVVPEGDPAIALAGLQLQVDVARLAVSVEFAQP